MNKRHGEPRKCEGCGNKSAFFKSEEMRKEVDGKILCFLCTRKQKRFRKEAILSKEIKILKQTKRNKKETGKINKTPKIKENLTSDKTVNVILQNFDKEKYNYCVVMNSKEFLSKVVFFTWLLEDKELSFERFEKTRKLLFENE